VSVTLHNRLFHHLPTYIRLIAFAADLGLVLVPHQNRMIGAPDVPTSGWLTGRGLGEGPGPLRA
jgi:hypothetical protein